MIEGERLPADEENYDLPGEGEEEEEEEGYEKEKEKRGMKQESTTPWEGKKKSRDEKPLLPSEGAGKEKQQKYGQKNLRLKTPRMKRCAKVKTLEKKKETYKAPSDPLHDPKRRKMMGENFLRQEGDTRLPNGISSRIPAAATAVDLISPDSSNEQSSNIPDVSGMGRAKKIEADTGSSDSSPGFFGNMYSWLSSKVDEQVGKLRRTLPSGRLFPLPSSSLALDQLFPETPKLILGTLRCLVWSLNSLNGEGLEGPNKASEFQETVLVSLLDDCARVCSWKVPSGLPSWEEFLKVKSVDYKGDEVLTAQTMRWENVQSALPQEVGGVELRAVVEHGCLHYVDNFEEYVLHPKDQTYVKPPRVMVPPEGWDEFCSHLLTLGVFDKVHEDDLYKVQDKPLLNGLFGVSKSEFDGPWEVMRIIMNLVPLNAVVRGFEGDVGTLPAWAGMTPLHLQPHEDLVVSSEDVRCFFYIFRVPKTWHKFMAFNRPLAPELGGDKPGKYYPCSAVLPMGFKNSVSLAQHVHRVIVKRSLQRSGAQGGEAELRKDRSFPTSNPMYRIYLDNFDQLEKLASEAASALKGQVSPMINGLKEEYAEWGIPNHPKKEVLRQTTAEVQGALVDGQLGIACPKVDKIARYAHLGRLLLEAGEATQKQMQIVGGGFVYMAMFRRPLLGALNHIWEFILACEGSPPFIRFPFSEELKHELTRFLGLIPLAFMDFRCSISPQVTASDASETGGGITVTTHLSPAGVVACNCPLRGDIVEPTEVPMVLTIGLFDGIGALRVAADAAGWNVQGHVSIEKAPEGRRVVESRFPQAVQVNTVEEVDLEMVRSWATQFTQVALVVLGAGPPCQGVSGLNASRKGALKDARSCLFTHVARIRDLVKQCFPWAQVRSLMESVASMNQQDQQVMSDSFGSQPWFIDAAGVSLAHRPRLYWIDWELTHQEGVVFGQTPVGRAEVKLHATLDPVDFLTPGWKPCSDQKFPTFTTSRPRGEPGYKPAGIQQCTPVELERWKHDQHRFPPYQYRDCHCIVNKHGVKRLLNISEREVIMGFPKGYTTNSVPKRDQGSVAHNDARLTLIGNSWNVTVVTWLLTQLGFLLGLNSALSLSQVVKRTSPGADTHFQTFVQRPFMRTLHRKKGPSRELELVKKFLSLVSIKGEDIMLVSASDDLAKYHRLRASVPPALWKWQTVAGWRWSGNPEHINALELRATLTALRWRLERNKKIHVKFVHLLDSLVSLHTLCRGRSSSKKLRRTVLRINALLLATKSQAVWAYVHTKLNPADAPSRRPQKRKWSHAQTPSWGTYARSKSTNAQTTWYFKKLDSTAINQSQISASQRWFLLLASRRKFGFAT